MVVDGLKTSAGHAAPLPVQFSARSQMPAALRQTVLVGANALPGQFADEPVQFSAGSHTPAELRHTVELGWRASPGQPSFVPSQFSAMSHTPADGRHGVLVGAFASVGHPVFVPSHVSARSHTPADARQSVPALPAGCVHALPTPSQTSSVQTFESAVHAVFAGCFASAGQVTFDPSQVSAASHSPAAVRQTTKAPATLSAGQP